MIKCPEKNGMLTELKRRHWVKLEASSHRLVELRSRQETQILDYQLWSRNSFGELHMIKTWAHLLIFMSATTLWWKNTTSFRKWELLMRKRSKVSTWQTENLIQTTSYFPYSPPTNRQVLIEGLTLFNNCYNHDISQRSFSIKSETVNC